MSGASLDMTLDDLIKSNKKSTGRGRGRSDGPGPARRPPNRSSNLAAPYAAPMAPGTASGHDMFSASGRASNIETGTKLYISNLDYGVSNEDIKTKLSQPFAAAQSSLGAKSPGWLALRRGYCEE